MSNVNRDPANCSNLVVNISVNIKETVNGHVKDDPLKRNGTEHFNVNSDSAIILQQFNLCVINY